jgi:hypothetical protein
LRKMKTELHDDEEEEEEDSRDLLHAWMSFNFMCNTRDGSALNKAWNNMRNSTSLVAVHQDWKHRSIDRSIDWCCIDEEVDLSAYNLVIINLFVLVIVPEEKRRRRRRRKRDCCCCWWW